MPFTDAEFPPEDRSILGEIGGDVPNDLEWVRAPDLLRMDGEVARHGGVPKLFDGIDPCDIMQGELGDCWLMSAIAALAEFPKWIAEEVFVTREYQPDGKYVLKLWDCAERKFVKVVIDDFIPCHKKGYFAKTPEPA